MTIRSAEEFVRLRSSQDPTEYRRAAHDDAPIAVWDAVIETRPDLKQWVVHNKTVPMEILRRLAGDPDGDLRRVVAGKRKLDRALFEQLAADPDKEVRRTVALNPGVPRDILVTLTGDSEEWVAEAARDRLTAARRAATKVE